MKEILVIGGGAAGMAAALRAAEQPGNRVTLLEKQARLGRKLLATGNGRCNLSNTGAAAERYHGAGPGFVLPALEAWPPEAVLGFFAELGLKTVTEYGGRVYPMSGHAGSVLDVLRLGLENRGVRVLIGASVTAAKRGRAGFAVKHEGGEARCDALIVACGGCAGGKLGGVRDGYRLLEGFGHRVTPLYPALSPIRTDPAYPRALKGVRADARVSLLRGDRRLAEARGDVLFTETGLSGTAVFDLSRAAATEGEGLTAALDFFPGEGEAALKRELFARRRRWPALEANRVLTGTVHSRVGLMLCKYAGLGGGGTLGEAPDAALARLAAAMKCFPLPVLGVGGFEGAQVTAGGVSTAEFDAHTLQSRMVPDLYACGEVLDVDGDCGGFNLQWAWASGLLAGDTL